MTTDGAKKIQENLKHVLKYIAARFVAVAWTSLLWSIPKAKSIKGQSFCWGTLGIISSQFLQHYLELYYWPSNFNEMDILIIALDYPLVQ